MSKNQVGAVAQVKKTKVPASVLMHSMDMVASGAAMVCSASSEKKGITLNWSSKIVKVNPNLSDVDNVKGAIEQAGTKFARLPVMTNFIYAMKNGLGVLAIKIGKSTALLVEPKPAAFSGAISTTYRNDNQVSHRKVTLKKGVLTFPVNVTITLDSLATRRSKSK